MLRSPASRASHAVSAQASKFWHVFVHNALLFLFFIVFQIRIFIYIHSLPFSFSHYFCGCCTCSLGLPVIPYSFRQRRRVIFYLCLLHSRQSRLVHGRHSKDGCHPSKNQEGEIRGNIGVLHAVTNWTCDPCSSSRRRCTLFCFKFPYSKERVWLQTWFDLFHLSIKQQKTFCISGSCAKEPSFQRFFHEAGQGAASRSPSQICNPTEAGNSAPLKIERPHTRLFRIQEV